MSKVDSQLQNEYATRALALQHDFQQKLEAARFAMDLVEMQKCAADFQTASAGLMVWFNEAVQKSFADAAEKAARVTDQDMDIYSHEHCAANLNRLAYRGDRNQMLGFMRDKMFSSLIKEVVAFNPMGNTHKALLSKALRLTPSVAPRLFNVVDRVREVLGMRVTPEIFVLQNAELTAGCYPIIHGRLPISISSGLLEHFSDDELAFVIGREFGRALFDHFRVPVDLLKTHASDQITPVQSLRLAAWERAREISVDRLGLLCCGSFDVAAAAFFKLSSGIVSPKFRFEIAGYMSQFRDLESYLRDAQDKEVEDLYSAHPFNPIRLKALELFSRSEMFREISGHGAGDIDNKQMELAIHGFCQLLEPSYLDDASETAHTIREFVFYSGLLIARTEGTVSDAQMVHLMSILAAPAGSESQDVTAVDARGWDENQIASRMQELAAKLNAELPVITKLNIVHDLATLITSDDSVSEDEVRILAMICETLKLDPMFTMAILPAPQIQDRAARAVRGAA